MIEEIDLKRQFGRMAQDEVSRPRARRDVLWQLAKRLIEVLGETKMIPRPQNIRIVVHGFRSVHFRATDATFSSSEGWLLKPERVHCSPSSRTTAPGARRCLPRHECDTDDKKKSRRCALPLA